ncbi:hypothetical protein KEK_21864 [Mycolicibacterium thermoresistibile ATCC 19527]|uniref:Uncharacterized protein n=1 Tax=Mycolicibacterium thermoresistibile (strain ATCC 19527 / DSM 44167 / CIP 105390 / JCM 6362 / NCTC 10409 / 316) TaxID=1078020 RepID=G7CMX5_MYCT3|nr:hypothetical protein KEK_21864 [Mycolicibacterium thermoresistibile ATCC 19527]
MIPVAVPVVVAPGQVLRAPVCRDGSVVRGADHLTTLYP